MNNNDVIASVLEGRSRLDKQIAGLRDQLAVLQKRRDALNQTINVLRSSDAELTQLGVVTLRNVDRGTVEEQILDILRGDGDGGRSISFIERELLKHDIAKSRSTLRRFLDEHPRVQRIGNRSSARYKLVEPDEPKPPSDKTT